MDMRAVSITVDGPVATLRLSRVERRNALNEAMVQQIEQFFRTPPAEVRSALLVADGEHFCAGLDLDEQKSRTPVETMHHSRLWHRAFDVMENGRIPVVSAVHGAVIGGGLELALATHVRVADTSAFFSLPEGRLGIFVGGGGSVRVGRVIGPDRMREMMLTGRRLSAEDGLRFGLVHEVVDAGAAEARALELAQRIGDNAPVANEVILSALTRIGDMSRSDGLWAEALASALTATTDDAREGLRAFLDKRPPEFRGS